MDHFYLLLICEYSHYRPVYSFTFSLVWPFFLACLSISFLFLGLLLPAQRLQRLWHQQDGLIGCSQLNTSKRRSCSCSAPSSLHNAWTRNPKLEGFTDSVKKSRTFKLQTSSLTSLYPLKQQFIKLYSIPKTSFVCTLYSSRSPPAIHRDAV